MIHQGKHMKTKTRGFTVIELLVVIAIIIILAGITFPVMHHVKAKGKQTKCISNLRQLYAACMMYTQEYDGFLPPFKNRLPDPGWTQRVGDGLPVPSLLYAALESYVNSKSILFCPTDPFAGKDVSRWGTYHLYTSYAYAFCRDPSLSTSGYQITTGEYREASEWGLIADPNSMYPRNIPIYEADNTPGCEHFGHQNVVYLDGHIGLYD